MNNIKKNIIYIASKFNKIILKNIENNNNINIDNEIFNILYNIDHIEYLEYIIKLYFLYEKNIILIEGYKNDTNSLYLAIIYLYYHFIILDYDYSTFLEATPSIETTINGIKIVNKRTLDIDNKLYPDFTRIYMDIIKNDNIYITHIRRLLLGVSIKDEYIIGEVKYNRISKI
jgi:hypothetical protein